MSDLREKVAIVTGAASGIGLAVATHLQHRGATVAITDIDATALGASGFANVFVADNRKIPDVERVVADMLARFGQIDIIVNNAGVSGSALPIEAIDEATFDRVFGTHVKGAFFLVRAAIGDMKRRRAGRIVNVASHSVMIGHDCMSHYVAAKGALASLTRCWAREFAPFGITVNSIAPGLVSTPMTRASIGEAEIAKRASGVPLGRIATADEVAGCVGWLVSDAATMMTGQLVSPNGGMAIVGM